MSGSYSPPPDRQPERVPPNRQTGSSRSTGLWIALCLIFVGFYHVSQSTPHALSDEEREETTAPVEASRPLWPFALPAATAIGFTLIFWRIRARLPEKYRTMELRTLAPTPPEETGVPPAFESFELKGKSDQKQVSVRVDEAGLHWSSEARLLQPAQWLDIGWEELKGITFAAAPAKRGTLVLWFIIIFTFIAFYSLFSQNPPASWESILSLGVIAVVVTVIYLAVFSKKGSQGSLTLITETHQLPFTSKDLDEARREQLKVIVKARRPELIPANEVSGWKALSFLWLRPFAESSKIMQSEAQLMALARAQSPSTLDDETALAAALQLKLFAVWTAGFCAFLPLTFGLALSLMTRSPIFFVAGYFFSWIVGFLMSMRLSKLFARLSGMSLIGG